jgi:hypothetical protein
LSLSVATAVEPLVPERARRIESYKQSDDVEEYVRMLRGAAVLQLQKWQPENQPPTPESISNAVDTIEGDG